MVKIAVIGAGSVVFTRRLVGDVLSFPSLSDARISLMDIDPRRLEVIAALCSRMARDARVAAQVEATCDRRRALEGADYVITTIRVGDRVEVDQGVPARYGVDQAVGDTIGPGGVMKALRTVPVLLDICRDMEELCPSAWLLNYTNPMAIACWAISQATEVKAVGLCHSVQNTARQLEGYMGLEEGSLDYWAAGINHMAWYLRLEQRGRDVYPLLREAMERPEVWAKDPVRFEVMRYFGYFVSESTRHMSEYVPYFRRHPAVMERLGLEPFDVQRWSRRREERDRRHYREAVADLEGEGPVELRRTNEYAAYMMDSMETGVPRRVNVNVRNTGLITNLPADACVEVPCLVDRLGVHPCYVGDLPEQCAALARTNVNVQALAVQAVLEADRRKALQAVALDPLTASQVPLDEIARMVDEMFQAQPEFLERYRSG